MIIKAAHFAVAAHSGQFRKFGHVNRPYVMHPGRVAARVSILPEATEVMVAAAWLHDVVEDTRFGIGELQLVFGQAVALLVGELTNTSKQQYPGLNREGRKAKDRERLVSVSREAKSIKLIDRIDNLMETEDDLETPCEFAELYRYESGLLLDVLRGTDAGLEAELEALLV